MSIDTIVNKIKEKLNPPEVEGRREFLEKSVKSAGYFGLAGLGLSALVDDADADTIESMWKCGKLEKQKFVHELPAPYEADKDLKGREFVDLMVEGFEAYDNHAFSHADKVFGYAGEIRPGNVEANIWQIKSWYHRIKNERGVEEAKKSGVRMAGNYLRTKPNNPALLEMKNRIERGLDPETFSLDAFELYEKGLDAYKKKDNKTAVKYFKKTIKNDPNNISAWRGISQTTYFLTEGSGKDKTLASLQVMYEARKHNPDSTEINWIITNKEKILKKY